MIILGLTGSIGMGKTTAARDFRRLGVAVHDADAAVHHLLSGDPDTMAAVEAAFPDTTDAAGVDRTALGRQVFDDPAALSRLEALLHPRVRRDQARFLWRCALMRRPLAVLDIPLLFETGAEARCDYVAAVSAPRFLQEQRVLARPGMTRDRLAAIRRRQTPEADKRRRADWVIPTGLGRAVSLRAIRRIVAELSGRRGRCWTPGYGA